MMIVYRDDQVELHQGHTLEILGACPAASVQSIVTSPPYWGLRDYGLEPVAWGGEPTCAHEWGDLLPPSLPGPGNSWESRMASSGLSNPAYHAQKPNKPPDAGCFCSCCGAWRGALGLEPTPELYVEHLVTVFADVWRVLRDDGTVWLNLGDCYATGAGRVGAAPGGGETTRLRDDKRGYRGERLPNGRESAPAAVLRRKTVGRGAHTQDNSGKAARRLAAMGPMTQPNRMPLVGLKPKDLVGIPWRVAFALQAWGWWLRADIIWAKGVSFCPTYSGAVMPESVRDRPTRAHEYLFLLAKAERYFADTDAIRERAIYADEARWDPGLDGHAVGVSHAGSGTSTRRFGWKRPAGWNDGPSELDLVGRYKTRVNPRPGSRGQAPEPGQPGAFHALGRNVRSVWAINPQPFAGAHFATFPERLVRPCVLVGTSARGACAACGAPWERVVTTCYRNDTTVSGRPAEGNHVKGGEGQGVRVFAVRTRRLDHTTGWRPTCGCYDAHYRDEFPQARRARKRHQRAASGDWWARARARPGRATWSTVPCVVADPFAGAATTLLVAKGLGRRAWGAELSAHYCQLGSERLGECERVQALERRQAVLPFGEAP